MNNEKDTKFDFGSMGKARVIELKNVELSELTGESVRTHESLQAFSSTGAIIGTVVILTALNPHETKAGATGVP